jgi:hypothetical protein
LGVGAAGTTNAGGGGGGYWGGGGGAAYAGGGGGSSFVSTGGFGVIHTSGFVDNSTNGSIRLTLPVSTTVPAPSQLVGTGWSRTSELTWATPGVNDITGYRVKWGTDIANIVNQFDISGGATTSFTHSGTPIAITSKSMTATVATLTTSTDHGLLVGQEVVVTGVDSTFNGTFTVASVPTTKSFTYALTGTAVASTAVTPTGLVQRTNNLILGQNYYYKIAAIYTDMTQSCTTLCLSTFTATSTVVGRSGLAQTFAFNDGTHTYKVPAGVTQIQVDAQGAQGGSSSIMSGGRGGRVQASVPVIPGETLFIYVGGGGGTYYPFTYKDPITAGRNGGGAGTGSGSGGGGATDIRRGFTVTNTVLTSNVATLTTSVAHGFAIGNDVMVTGVSDLFDGVVRVTAVTANTFSFAKTNPNLTSTVVDGAVFYSNPSLGLSRRILVAGGGGGGADYAAKNGGAGGGLVGGKGLGQSCPANCGGMGGGQTFGSALGIGGVGTTNAGGGGGGYYGGYGSGLANQPGDDGVGGYSGGGGG